MFVWSVFVQNMALVMTVSTISNDALSAAVVAFIIVTNVPVKVVNQFSVFLLQRPKLPQQNEVVNLQRLQLPFHIEQETFLLSHLLMQQTYLRLLPG
jgi:hypothetical protein